MEGIKRLEMGFSDHQRSRKRFPRKSSREPALAEKTAEVVKVPTILKKVLNKENGVANEYMNGYASQPSEWNNSPKSNKNTTLANEFSHEPKLFQHPAKIQQPDQSHQGENIQNYNQNYPQLLKKVPSVTEQEKYVKEVGAKSLPANNSATNMVRAIEKAREYSSSWVPRVMKAPVKLINNFSWVAQSPNLLMEQSNYVVVGVLGAQSTGKSTLLSHLAGYPATPTSKMIFEAPPVEHLTNHSTQGVDLFVTQERMILLDSQAVFSMSSTAVLKKKKRFVGEKHFCQDSVDAQSLQLASFFLSVCNVVIVVIDWFIDDQLIKLLSIAEMLKPKATLNLQDVQNPHVVFVLNRATEMDWLSLKQMNLFLTPLLCKHSLLRFTGMFEEKQEGDEKDTQKQNVILLPPFQAPSDAGIADVTNSFDNNKSPISSLTTPRPPFLSNHPSYQQQIRFLRNTLLSLPRDQMFNKLPEKTWLQYAAKAWDLVRKSPFISDYSRLLS